MVEVGSISAEFKLNSDKFLAGMKKVESSTQTISRTVEKSGKKMERVMVSSFNAIRIAAGAAALVGVGALTTGLAELFSGVEAIDRKLKFATGSTEQASAVFSMLRGESERLGLAVEVLASRYGSLAAAAKGTTLEGEGAENIFLAVSEASAVLGLSIDDTRGAFYAIQQMISKGQITAEEMKNQLGERLPGAMQILSRATKMTVAELNKVMEVGGLMSSEVLPLLANQMREELAGSVEEASKSVNASFNRMKNALFDMKREFTKEHSDVVGGFFNVLTSTIKGTSSAIRALTGVTKLFFAQFSSNKGGIEELQDFSNAGVLGLAAMFEEEEKGVTEKTETIFTKMEDFYNNLASNNKSVGTLGPMVINSKEILESVDKVEAEVVSASKSMGSAVSSSVEEAVKSVSISSTKMVSTVSDGISVASLEVEGRIKLFSNKFATLTETLNTRMALAGVDSFESSQIQIAAIRDNQLAEVQKFYDAQVRFLEDSNATKIALTKEYESTISLINETASMELEQIKKEQADTMFETTIKPVLDLVEGAVRQTTSLFVDMARGGKTSFKDLVDSILVDIQKFITELFIVQPLIKAFKDLMQSVGFGSSGGGTASSIIGALTSAIGFADGGILEEPVVGVGLNSGNKYSFAESGPEAIVPLSDIGGRDAGLEERPTYGGNNYQDPEEYSPNEETSEKSDSGTYPEYNIIEPSKNKAQPTEYKEAQSIAEKRREPTVYKKAKPISEKRVQPTDYKRATPISDKLRTPAEYKQSTPILEKLRKPAAEYKKAEPISDKRSEPSENRKDFTFRPEARQENSVDSNQQKTVENINITINAIDSKSLVELLRANPQAITAPIVDALQLGDRGLAAAIRGAI